jgi:regulatory protein
MSEMKKILSVSEAFARYSALCARREYCQHDLADKMRRNGMQEQQIAEVLSALEHEDYVNDKRYCEAFVHDKMVFSHWGRVRIRMELRKRHLPSEIISSAMDTIDEDIYREQLLELLSNYGKTVRAQSDYERYNKMIRYACNHGYEYDIVVELMEDHDL